MAAIPLWGELNDTLWSDVFYVAPGWCAVLFAAGLQQEKARKSADEFKGPQVVCVERLVFEAGKASPAEPSACGCIREFPAALSAKLKSAEHVETCSLPWELEPCRNLGVIGIPGAYRLALNDATAVGDVQVYAEFYEAGAVAPQAYGAFFQ